MQAYRRKPTHTVDVADVRSCVCRRMQPILQDSIGNWGCNANSGFSI